MAIAGCGDGGGEKTPTATRPSATPSARSPSATPAPAAVTQSWARVALTGAPGARRDHSLTFNPDDGLIYMFGGRAQGVADNQLWSFDPGRARGRSSRPGGPEPRFAHNASMTRGKAPRRRARPRERRGVLQRRAGRMERVYGHGLTPTPRRGRRSATAPAAPRMSPPTAS